MLLFNEVLNRTRRIDRKKTISFTSKSIFGTIRTVAASANASVCVIGCGFLLNEDTDIYRRAEFGNDIKKMHRDLLDCGSAASRWWAKIEPDRCVPIGRCPSACVSVCVCDVNKICLIGPAAHQRTSSAPRRPERRNAIDDAPTMPPTRGPPSLHPLSSIDSSLTLAWYFCYQGGKKSPPPPPSDEADPSWPTSR